MRDGTTAPIRDTLLLAGSVFLAATLLAYAADWLQHNTWSRPYLLLPVNVTSFYFLPIFAAALLFRARKRTRASRAVVVAVILTFAFTAARLTYWWLVARDLSLSLETARLPAAVAARPPSFWAVSILGLNLSSG